MSKPGSGPSQIRDVKWHRLGILEGALGAAKSTQEAVAAEREACALIADAVAEATINSDGVDSAGLADCELIAEKIRARGGKAETIPARDLKCTVTDGGAFTPAEMRFNPNAFAWPSTGGKK